MASAPHKLALLIIRQYLLDHTDESHTANATDLAAELEKYGLSENRRTIYNDIDTLIDSGLDVITPEKSDNRGGYYIGSRDFELAELKLLVDAVQSSKFITAKKSEELIAKLAGLTSKPQAAALRREVFIRNRIKAGNESIFYNVDGIYEAIHENRQITFRYGEIKRDGTLVPRKNGAVYQVSPMILTWDDENNYLVAYESASEKVKHYRVDKIMDLERTELPRTGMEAYRKFDLAAFAKKTFGMFGGVDTDVTLRCRNHLAGVMIDRFGKDTMLIPDGDTHFRAHVQVAVSPQFFGWVTGIGSGMEILSPAGLRKEYAEYLSGIAAGYTSSSPRRGPDQSG